MIKIDFDPTTLTGEDLQWWQKWEKKALSATQEVKQEWEKWIIARTPGAKFGYKFKEAIWKELKDWLIEKVFNEKCAYCENRLVGSYFDAEHFRPKAEVHCKNMGKWQQVKALDELGNLIDHPGYFWLAYNWKNLVPSCKKCNSGSGKQNKFPVSKQHIFVHHSTTGSPQKYLDPKNLDALEDPLLLNPYEDDPKNHLIFGEVGIVAAQNNSEKGKHSIEVYDLSRDDLARDRHEKQRDAYNKYMIALHYALNFRKLDRTQSKNAAYQDIKKLIASEKFSYSAAILDYIKEIENITS